MDKCEFKSLVKSQDPGKKVLIRHVNVFDGLNENIIPNQDILLEGGRIASITSGGSLNTENVVCLEGQGKTLTPGFIDSHVHVSGSGSVPWRNRKANVQYNFDAYLYSGITSIYDLGGMAGQLKKLSRKVREGAMNGPDLYHTHLPITIRNSHPIPLSKIMLPGPLKFLVNYVVPTIQRESDAKKIIRKMKNRGVQYIKLICDKIPPNSPEMPFQFMKALVNEVHENGFKVFVHIGSVANALTAVKAGADILAHGIWRDRLTEEQADEIAQSGVKIIYTLAGFVNVDKINTGTFDPNAIDRKLVPCCILDPVEKEKGKEVNGKKVIGEFFQDVTNHRPHWEHNFELLNKRNVEILVGTDSNLPGTYAGATYFQEMYELKKIGLSNYKILRGATGGNACLFFKDPDFGTIQEGKRADLLLFDGNPLENLALVENPVKIIKAGKFIERLI